MTEGEKWICWELSEEDIDRTARRIGVDPRKLTTQDYENIAKKFRHEFKKVNRQWLLILEDAIETMAR